MKKTCPIIAAERSYTVEKEKCVPVSEYYGEDTFNIKVMKVKLPGDTYKKIIDAYHEGTILDIDNRQYCRPCHEGMGHRKGRDPFRPLVPAHDRDHGGEA